MKAAIKTRDFSAHFKDSNLGRIVAKQALFDASGDFTQAKNLFNKWVDADTDLYNALASMLMEQAITTWCGEASRNYRNSVLRLDNGKLSDIANSTQGCSDTQHSCKNGAPKPNPGLIDAMINGHKWKWGRLLLEQDYGLLDGTRFKLKDATKPVLSNAMLMYRNQATALKQDYKYFETISARLPDDTMCVGDVLAEDEIEKIAMKVGYGRRGKSIFGKLVSKSGCR